MKKLINLLLLVVMSFSIAHGVVLDTHADEHCSIQEYVEEFSSPNVHDHHEHESDSCETHYLLHISFLLPSLLSFYEFSNIKTPLEFKALSNPVLYTPNTFRPPIA